MAKSAKSGLGRGLNSLLGGAYEEAAPIEAAPQRTLVERDEPNNGENKPVNSNVRVPESNSEGQELAQEESIADGETHVTIKSVVQRRTDEVPIDAVSPNPDQPRTNFKKESLEELAASIQKDGLLQPILVRPLGKLASWSV